MKDYLKLDLLNKTSDMYDKWEKILMENDEDKFNNEFDKLTNCDMKIHKEKLLEFAIFSYITARGNK